MVYKVRRVCDGRWWTGRSVRAARVFGQSEWTQDFGRVYTRKDRAQVALLGAALRGYGVELVEFALVEQRQGSD